MPFGISIDIREDPYMGWLRSVGSIKLEVSFAKDPTKETVFCKRDL